MKNFFFFPVVFFSMIISTSTARNFYIAANGNNNNNGLTAATPWQTISKLNASFSGIAAGDSILFRRGDTFYGVVIVAKSGASGRPIVFAAYGDGQKPVITGFVRATNWTSVNGRVYEASVPGAKSTLNMVTINGQPRAMGRYPNANTSNGGYLTYESFSGNNSITDNQLTSATNWTGAEVVVRKTLWVIDRGTVTSHSGGRLNFVNKYGSTYNGSNNYGYFIQNDPRTLDQVGEWYFNNSNKKLQFHFGGSNPAIFNIGVSTLDTLFKMINKSYINVNNLVFEGANGTALYAEMGAYVNVQNCDFVNAGDGAINYKAMSNVLIENCTTRDILSNGFKIEASKSTNITIRGCTMKKTGAIPGMGGGNGNTYKAIFVNALSNILIEYNRIDTTGYLGIEFQGSNVTVRNNVIDHFNYLKDDGGGIYTYAGGNDANPGPTYTNRVISNNIIMNGIGAPDGRSSNSLYSSGIYLDGRSMNVSVINNSLFNIGKNGIHCNNPINVTVTGNTCYNALNTMSVARWSGSTARNLVVKNNVFYPATNTQKGFNYVNTGINQPVVTPLQTAIKSLGTMDSNIYSMINPAGFGFEVYSTSGGAGIPASPLSLEGWRTLSGFDINGKKPVKVPVAYKLNSLIGANKVTNGTFNSLISGFTLFGSSVLSLWDNTNKISGGSLRMTFSSPVANRYGLLHSPVGALSSSKKYVVRVSTFGTTTKGIIRAYIRRTSSPYENLVPLQVKPFGLGITNHEFLFTSPTTVTAGSVVIEIEQNSGTTYIDNVSLHEADATEYDAASQLRFVYNDTRSAKTISLGDTYVGVTGIVYNGAITLQPFTSQVLVQDLGTAAARMAPADSVTIVDSIMQFTADLTSGTADAGSIAPQPTKATETTAKTAAANRGDANQLTKSSALSMKAFPNPTSSSFNLAIDGGSEERVSIMVYSIDGKPVHQTVGNSNARFSFGNNFMPGIYIVKVIQGSTVQTLRVVKTGN